MSPLGDISALRVNLCHLSYLLKVPYLLFDPKWMCYKILEWMIMLQEHKLIQTSKSIIYNLTYNLRNQ